ncbi:MAG: TonB-dependent receptor [Acidobacteria bacterium]|nr:TonB-dependent receptor [Acidobacteriota bacterium]
MKLLQCLLLAACALFAQQDMGVVTGLVTDSTGALIPGARVTVTNRDTNESRSLETNAAGSYTIGPLRIGNYDIAVEKTGFKKTLRQGLELHAQDRVRADFQLEIGQMTEAVSVSADAPLLQSESSTLANVVEQHAIRELPLNSRNFQQLAWLSPGATPAPKSRDRDSGFNSHGQWMTQNNFVIDGVDNNNNIMGMQDRKAQVVVPSLDAVAEFKVETSNYSAEFGRNSGAVMIVSIKSGTNAFHGTAYDYLRNDKFDSRDTFNYVDRTGDRKADPGILRQNQFGATIGGPIVRNKTFFFFSWESRLIRLGQTDSAIVPTADEKNGIFSPNLRVIRDPLNGQPFSGNAIPRSRFDSTSTRLLELWPAPNFTGSTRNNFIRNPPWNTDNHQYDTRIDHNLTSRDKLFARLSFAAFKNFRDSVFPQPARGGQGNDRALDDNPARNFAFSYTRILSSSLVNEFRYGFIRQKTDKRELVDTPFGDLAAQYGFKGIPVAGRLFGLPQITLSGAIGYQGLGEPGSMPNFKIHQVHQYLNNLSWNRGTHNFKFGTDLRWNRSDIFGGGSAHGQFTFDGTITGISFADFLLGNVTQANITSLLIGNMRFRNYMWYGQDDWKLTAKLTLNVGMRYELTSPWWEKYNNMNALVTDPGAAFNTIRTAGYCGDSWSCRGLVSTDTNNWAPRIGLAYQLSSKAVLRAGAGVFYGGQGALGASARGVNNFPYNRNATLQSSGTTPAIVLSSGLPANLLGNTTVPPANAGWTNFEQNLPAPQIHQWNAALQRELFRNFTLTLAYVGSGSQFLMNSYNWNGSQPGPVATERNRRKIAQWNNITLNAPYAHSTYHGMDVKLERRFAKGFSLSASYTWSHSLDNTDEQFGSGGGAVQDFANWALSKGSSGFDSRHRFITSTVYELPFGKGRRYINRGGVVDALLGGWQLSNMVAIQRGQAFSITLANARTRLGATLLGDWWPDRIADPSISNPTRDRWLNPAAFILPRTASGDFRFGNAGRAIITGDGPFNWDSGMMKTFRITERIRTQVRWEVFNITNTPVYDIPQRSFDSPDFGKVTATINTPRQMQFAIRLSF